VTELRVATNDPPADDPLEASVFKPDSTVPDEKANAEANALANGKELDADGAKKEHNRHQSFRDHLNKAALVLFWTIVVCLIGGIATYAFHMLTPGAWHYLGADQLKELKTVLVSALFSSALSGYVNKRMA
jgi:hypothetical protein